MKKMKLQDGKIKNTLRMGIKLLHKYPYERYVKEMRRRGGDLPAFTLLTSDCMGGLIYHTLGREFLSPTINLSIKDPDFIKLVSDLPYYFEQEFRFIASSTYPIGCLGEGGKSIEVRFEHYKTPQEAVEKWNARKQRITENVYVIMADKGLSDEDIQRFRELDKHLRIKRKIMFTWIPEHADGKEIFCIKRYGRERIKNYSKLRKDGFRDYEKFFDYIAWIKMEDHFMIEEETAVN